jgi:hypothetical protein
MDREVVSDSEPGLATLVGGIARDGQTLLKQQVELLRAEVKQELRQLRRGMLSLGIGAGIGAIGAVFLLATLAHVLKAYTQIPMWGCYAIVGGVVTATGLAILFGGKKSVSDVRLTPPPVTAQALKENVEWIRNRGKHEAIP